jgi:hypothetical protein
MKKILLFSAFFLFINAAHSQAWQWVRSHTSTKNGYGVCTDGLGNCYSIGDSSGFNSLFKYDNSGNLLWRHTCWTAGYVRAVSCDGNGHIVVAGDSAATTMLSRYDLSGNILWHVTAGTGKAYAAISPASGNVYLTSDNSIRKYDSLGVLVWNDSITARGCAISSDSFENIYVTGRFSGTQVFGADTLTSAGGYDIFIAKYNASGTCLWAKRAGGIYSTGLGSFWFDCGNGIATDAAGNSYVTGQIVDSADFDTFHIVGTNYDEIFLVKYDPSGNVVWVTLATGGSDEEGRCVVIDRNGDVLIGGSYVPAVDFGLVHLTGWANYDAFIAKYDNAGNFKGVIKAGGYDWNEYVYGLCSDNAGNVFAAGSFCGTSYFDSDSLVTPFASGFWMFVAKIDETMSVPDINPEKLTIQVFPNPAVSIINVKFESYGRSIMEIKNILGQTIYTEPLLPGKKIHEIAVRDFPAGLYVVQISMADGIYSAKFIKQ